MTRFSATLGSSVTAAVLVGLFAGAAEAKPQSKLVEYKDGETVLEGYLVWDDETDKARPGVLVVHDWMGISDETRRRADMLASLGYVAFAADVYGKGVRPADAKAAAALAGQYKGGDRALLRRRLKAGLDTLSRAKHVQAGKVAAVGYCFGGTGVLELARSGAPLLGVVSFHGGLDSPRPADGLAIRGRVLALHGADDPYSTAADVAAFQEELRRAGVDWQMVLYGGAVHAFTNPGAGSDPSKGVAFNDKADRRSWVAMREFLGELFQ